MNCAPKLVWIDFPMANGEQTAAIALPHSISRQDADRLIALIKCWPKTTDESLSELVTKSLLAKGEIA